ncbi:MAG: hypothetical protein WBV23_09175 [Desulfobaccales bacterium]
MNGFSSEGMARGSCLEICPEVLRFNEINEIYAREGYTIVINQR